jgi:hypothetical protein
MKQRRLAATIVAVIWASAASAQEPNWRFQWQKGQVLTYKAEHKTSVEEVIEKSKVVTGSKLTVVKRWEVVEVDAKGTAVLRLSLTAMRNEQIRPNGETMLFDSTELEKSSPELRDQMSKFIGQTLAVLSIDSQGRVLDVKQGSAARYEAEPPFAVVFPPSPAQVGQGWLRPYGVTLDPPYGAGEKYDAKQSIKCTNIAAGKATLAIANQFAKMPENVKDHVPLIQKMAEGQATFDLQAGRVIDVQLNIDRTLTNHHGEGSSYRFKSSFSEKLIDAH